jgi:hypothetical protein
MRGRRAEGSFVSRRALVSRSPAKMLAMRRAAPPEHLRDLKERANERTSGPTEDQHGVPTKENP